MMRTVVEPSATGSAKVGPSGGGAVVSVVVVGIAVLTGAVVGKAVVGNAVLTGAVVGSSGSVIVGPSGGGAVVELETVVGLVRLVELVRPTSVVSVVVLG